MFRTKTIIRARKLGKDDDIFPGAWAIIRGKRTRIFHIGISRLFRLISTLISDKKYIYSIDIIIKRKR